MRVDAAFQPPQFLGFRGIANIYTVQDDTAVCSDTVLHYCSLSNMRICKDSLFKRQKTVQGGTFAVELFLELYWWCELQGPDLQPLEGTHKSVLPVSKHTVKFLGGVPNWMTP